MIDKIIQFSIRNKAFVALLTIGLIIGGIFAAMKLPIDAVPDITNNQVIVITRAPGLSTEDIERYVTYQVELAMSNLPGVEEIRSISRFGLSVVTIVFKENMGTYLPRQLVSEKLEEIKESIPQGFGEPSMAPISTGLGEIYQYTLEVDPKYRDKYDDMQLRTIQDWIVKRQLSMLPGVVEVNSFGGRKKQYEVAVDPDRLRSYGLSILDIYRALETNNGNTGGAYIEKNHQANFIRGVGLMTSLDDIRNTLVTNINGKPIYIRDVAQVRYGNAVRYGAFTKDGKGEAVGGIIMMLKGANSNEVIKLVKQRMAQIQKSLPEGITIKPFIDRSKLIKKTTSTVAENLTLGALIVIFVLVLLLGNMRGGLIVASTIPLALLFTFILMKAFGVWANLMSLGAIDFGILVDGAVIIVENTIFYMHKKMFIGRRLLPAQRDKIAAEASSKMMNSAFFGQMIILIVFIPILALQGVEGKMFRPMALTFGFALLGVMFLSLTYIPMMAALFLQPPKTDKPNIGDRIVRWFERQYLQVINFSLKHKITILVTAGLFLISSIIVFTRMGSEFLPQLDEGDIAMQAILRPGTALTDVIETTTKIERLVLDNFPDEFESIQSRIGVADIPMDPMPMDIADMFIILKPKDQWTKARTKQELIEKIKQTVSQIPGVNYEFSQPIEMRFNELLTGVREDIAIKLYGEDLGILADKAQEIARLINGIPGIQGIKVEATSGLPQITIKYDREKLGLYGLNIRELNKIIETAFSGGIAGKIYEGEKMFDLVVRLHPEKRHSIENVRNLFVPLPNGSQVPLKEVAEIKYMPGPMQISRDNTNRRIYVGVNVGDRDIKSLVDDIQKVLDEKLDLPPGYYIRYGGAFENLERATKRLSILVPLSLALIFVLVYFAVKSLRQTLMIYIAIPLAAVGGVFALYLRGMPFSISAGVGFIVLFGVAVLNGLVLINGLNDLRKNSDMDFLDIVKQGAKRRIRPILLTASTDILGFLPMAISTSAGAEVQRPLATVVIGGMFTSALLTLVVLPVLYAMVENRKPKANGNSNNGIKATVLAMLMLFIGFNLQAQSSVNQNNISIDNLLKTTTIQDNSGSISLKQAQILAQENYPLLKAKKVNIHKQQVLRATAIDLGQTTLSTGAEEIGQTTGVNNIIGVEQGDIDLLSIPVRSRLARSRVQAAEAEYDLTRADILRQVSHSWADAWSYRNLVQLYQMLDSLYKDFLKIAEIRYKSQQSSKIEFLTAETKYSQIKLQIQNIESQYRSALINLNRYLLLDTLVDVGDIGLDSLRTWQDDSLINSPIINYSQKQVQVAQAQWKAERASLLPKFTIGYTSQAVDGQRGYFSWQAGISIPLSPSRPAQVKASRLEYEISSFVHEETQIKVKAKYADLINKLTVLRQMIDYYEKKAIPVANEQIRAALLGYRLGSIDYLQFIQNIENALKTKQDYILTANEYLKTLFDLQYITGKF